MAQGISIPVVQSGLEASIQQGVKNVGQINIQATVDPSAFKNLAQPLGRVSGLATEFEKSIAASNARVLAFGASVGIINGVQNAFASLVTTGIEVQKTLADIAAISGRSGAELSKFGDSLFEIGKTTGQTFKTASEAALEFSRQGLSVEETLKRTNDALTLTRFTTLSASEAVDVLTAAANSFSETGITTAQIINKLVAVDTKFAVSAEDLAKGLARAGSIAQEVGVNFDQLNAAVTVAQERTARGGAVIGNALKTIFTRLRSDETVQALRDIGVESLDSQGKLKGAIPLLEELSKKLQGLSGGERVQILEAVASKYNINILSALLTDLGTANSKFGQAVAISAGAGNQAYERQIELNKTLAAQINNATVSVTQLFNKLAEIGVTESLSNLLSFVNDLLSGFNKLLDSGSVGGDIAKGLIKGISDVFFTIGLPVLAAIFVKLTTDIAKFGVESLKTILGINQQVRERQALEQAVVNTLIRDQEVMASILALSGNRAKQEEYLLGVYNRQISALQQVQNIASSVAPALMTGGLSATSGQVKKRGAGGYLPAQEAADVRRGVGGASSSSKVVSIPNFAFGGGKRGTMIANTSEYIVPNFANGGSAIFNQDMARAYGLPAGAKKISAAGGYVPNFADYSYFNLKPQYAGSGLPAEFSSVRSTAKANAEAKIAEYAKAKGMDPQSVINTLYTSQKGVQKTGLTVNSIDYSGGAAMLLPDQAMAAAVNANSMGMGVKTKDGKGVADFVKFKAYGFSQSSVDNLAKKSNGETGVIGGISDSVSNVIYGEGSRIVNLFKPLTKTPINSAAFKEIYDKKGGAGGAAKAVAGSIFEAAMDYALNPKDSPEALKAIKSAEGKTFDVLNFQEAKLLREAFGATNAKEAFADYKISAERDRAFADQIILNGAYQKMGPKASSGYIPNFAAGSPLGEAVNREMAAGVSPSKIRITQDGRLRNSDNPNGLAVINTRDEPNGKIPNFNQRLGKKAIREREARAGNINAYPEPIGPQMVGSGSVAPTSIPTKAQVSDEASVKKANEELAKSTQGASLGILKMSAVFGALSSASYMLEASIKQTDSSVLKFTKGLVDVGQKASLGLTIGEGFKPILEMGSKLPGVMGVFTKSLAGASPVIGAVVGGLFGLVDVLEHIATEDQRKGAKTASELVSSVSNLSTDKQIKFLQEKLDATNNPINAGQQAAVTQRAANVQTVNKAMGYGTGGGIGFAQAMTPQTKEGKKAEEDMRIAQGAKTVLEERLKQLKAIKDGEKSASDEAKKRQKEEQDKAETDLNTRVSLESQLAGLNIANAIGEATATKARAKSYADLIEQASQLTAVEKRRADAALRVKDIEDKINTIGKDTLANLLKGVVDKSKLASVNADEVKSLMERYETQGDTLDLEKEANKLGIQGVAALKRLLEQAKESATLAKIKLDAEKESLKTTNQATEAGALQATRDKNRLAFLNEELNINKRIKDSQEENRIEQEIFNRGSAVRNLRKQIAANPFATQKQQSQLAILEEDAKYAEEVKKIENNLSKDREKNFTDINSRVRATIQNNEGIAGSKKEEVINLIKEANSIQKLTNLIDVLEEKKRLAADEDQNSIQLTIDLLNKEIEALNALNTTAQGKRDRSLGELADPKDTAKRQRDILTGTVKGGMYDAFADISKETSSFSETFGKNTTLAFRDGLRDAMSAAISQTDDLGAALQNVATGFLKTMQNAFLQKAANNITSAIGTKMGIPIPVSGFAKGGMITGGSGYRDDVPAMLTSGEFVMRKSAVQKYGAANLERMNSGGMFIPGTRGGGAISGDDALRAFANQTTTSGATDVLRGGGSSAFINLEDQSQKLSRYALLGDDTISQEVRGAQGQAFDILKSKSDFEKQQKEMEKQQKKALTRQLISTVATAALSYGAGKLAGPKGSVNLSKTGYDYSKKLAPDPINPFNVLNGRKGPTALAAYGGLIRRYASGGPTDDIPAMLMSGEYVMNRGASRKYGKQFLDSMNQGRAPRFADGGEATPSSPTTTTESNVKGMGDVSININVTGQTSQTETQGSSTQGGIDYKKMSEKIKMVVMETLNEEKRLGGSLRTR